MAIVKTLSKPEETFGSTRTADGCPAELLPFVKTTAERGVTNDITDEVPEVPNKVGRCGTRSDRQEPLAMRYQFGCLSIDLYGKDGLQTALHIPNVEMRPDSEIMMHTCAL